MRLAGVFIDDADLGFVPRKDIFDHIALAETV